jgi:hypothetical protein
MGRPAAPKADDKRFFNFFSRAFDVDCPAASEVGDEDFNFVSRAPGTSVKIKGDFDEAANKRLLKECERFHDSVAATKYQAFNQAITTVAVSTGVTTGVTTAIIACTTLAI